MLTYGKNTLSAEGNFLVAAVLQVASRGEEKTETLGALIVPCFTIYLWFVTI